MRSDVSSSVQLPLFASRGVRWEAVPSEARREIIELLARLFVEEVPSSKPVIEEDARDGRKDSC